MRHRAEAFAARVEALLASSEAGETVAARMANAGRIHASWLRLIYLHHAETAEESFLRAAYLKAAKG
jgi:hypothetical protein